VKKLTWLTAIAWLALAIAPVNCPAQGDAATDPARAQGQPGATQPQSGPAATPPPAVAGPGGPSGAAGKDTGAAKPEQRPAPPSNAAPGAAAASVPAAAAPQQHGQLYAPSTQLVNFPLRIFVSRDIGPGVTPILHFSFAGGGGTKPAKCPDIPASFVARNQSWTGGADVDGVDTQHTGTVLLFKIPVSDCTFSPWKSMVRAIPVVRWTDPAGQCNDCVLFAKEPINLSNAHVAFVEALLLVALIAIAIVLVARSHGRHRPIELLFSTDGTLSLSMTQMALWTLATGLMVTFEVLLKLDTPEIPASLVVLMGITVATTGASFQLSSSLPRKPGAAPPVAPAAQPGAQAVDQVPPQPQVPPPQPPQPPPRKGHWELSDLVTVPSPEVAGASTLSLARAQMLFWTLILVIVFIGKSTISQELWDIPWELVALLGVSQAGYLGSKFA
jgi:hypothetical protein